MEWIITSDRKTCKHIFNDLNIAVKEFNTYVRVPLSIYEISSLIDTKSVEKSGINAKYMLYRVTDDKDYEF